MLRLFAVTLLLEFAALLYALLFSKKEIKNRTIYLIGLTLVFYGASFGGQILFLTFVFLLVLLGGCEAAKCSGLHLVGGMLIASGSAAVVILSPAGWMVPGVVSLFLVLASVILFFFSWKMLNKLSGIVLELIIGGGLGSFFCCQAADRDCLAVFVTAIVLNDAFGFFIGKAFGGHHPFSHISPNKSTEGYLGGIVGVIFAFFLGILCVPAFAAIGAREIVLQGLLLWPAACMGDLFFSACKRKYEVKDFGTILGAHGGVLDRMDDIIYTMPFLAVTMWLFL